MINKYQNFTTKHGNIVFPIFFVILYLFFIIQPFYYVAKTDLQQHIDIANFYNQNTIGYFYTSIASYMGVFPIIAILCTIAFFIVFYKTKRIIKPLLFIVPLCYLLQISILGIMSISDKAITNIPFVAFYLIFVLFIFAVLYAIPNRRCEND